MILKILKINIKQEQFQIIYSLIMENSVNIKFIAVKKITPLANISSI